jgi:hypothetical protein
MNVVVAMWAMVLGGVALPGDQPAASTYGRPSAESGVLVPGVQGGSTRGPSFYLPRDQSGSLSGGGGVTVGSTPGQNLVPFAPTDPLAGSERFPWGPPTEYSAPADGAVGLRPSLDSLSRPYVVSPSGKSPYDRWASSRSGYQGYSSASGYGSTRTSDAFQRAASRAPQATAASKPFSDYRAPSGVSPYMNLFRTDRTDGVDNYNLLVKPRLDQRRDNQLFGKEIRGLQGASQQHGSALRNLGRAPQGGNVPGYYRNYGGYYPGLQR